MIMEQYLFFALFSKYTANRITQLGSEKLQKKVRLTHNAMLGSEAQPQPQSPSSALTHKAPETKICQVIKVSPVNVNGLPSSRNSNVQGTGGTKQ